LLPPWSCPTGLSAKAVARIAGEDRPWLRALALYGVDGGTRPPTDRLTQNPGDHEPIRAAARGGWWWAFARQLVARGGPSCAPQ
jgi:hypothetical protein